jgi:hypothetical protein
VSRSETSTAAPTTKQWADKDIETMVKEIDHAKATADPLLEDVCFTMNVNGECLDHLDYTKGKISIILNHSFIKAPTSDYFCFKLLWRDFCRCFNILHLIFNQFPNA